MGIFIGVDVGGTFTDFLVMDGNKSRVFKVFTTPRDPSIGFINGLEAIASSYSMSLEEFVPKIERIVHGTTVATNAVLTGNGAKVGLLTTEGVRDALEMRRGIREERYNNHLTNVPPLVPRYLRLGIAERIGPEGQELKPLDSDQVAAACDFFSQENIGATAICFMNSFVNPEHESKAKAILQAKLPHLYHSVSSEVLPAIRFYNRISTTVLNAYVGPILDHYMVNLVRKLKEKGFLGTLLIMQSNGGVVTPQVAKEKAATTLLSGPAAGPTAGLLYAAPLDLKDFITIDMGGTSFDVALIKNLQPITMTEGELDRYALSLPMIGIISIGAGGGSIGWIDEGGLLRMGPRSAAADPGPVCYAKGGSEPACTDADLILGYLDPHCFAGGLLTLDKEAAYRAIAERIAKPLGMSVEEAAAGMYRVINTNMALAVREATIKRGYDPREFPMVVAGGAGPLHAAMIARELEMPFFIVPRESSAFCASGMLLSDLRHDFVRSCVSRWDKIAPPELRNIVREMIAAGQKTLAGEGIAPEKSFFEIRVDLRYVKQYHEVSIAVSPLDLGIGEVQMARAKSFRIEVPGRPVEGKLNAEAVMALFHEEHNRLFGYSLKDEKTPVELVNIRLQAIGETVKPVFSRAQKIEGDERHVLKGTRKALVPERGIFCEVKVYDASKLGIGATVEGPAILEQPTTTIVVSADFDMVVDSFGSYVVYVKEKKELLPKSLFDVSTSKPTIRSDKKGKNR